MTIRIPPKNIFDKILKLFGKEWKVIIPNGVDKIYNEKNVCSDTGKNKKLAEEIIR